MAAESGGTYVFASELGWMAVVWQDHYLTRLTFGHPSRGSALASLEADGAAIGSGETAPPDWVEDLSSRLQSYAAGNDEKFDDIPVDLSHLSAFQLRVAKACRRIGRGRVRTYGELAASCGSPGAARAVGNVMAQNRYPIIVPCHRVVGSAGSLGGFSARDGISMKRRMLDMEGATIRKAARPRREALLGTSGT